MSEPWGETGDTAGSAELNKQTKASQLINISCNLHSPFCYHHNKNLICMVFTSGKNYKTDEMWKLYIYQSGFKISSR
jgi:hypothetical protein